MENACILVVEDQNIIALDLKNRLINLGYVVPATIAYGEEAIAKVEELRPDLVLMDIVLKGEMDGVQAAEQIREQYDLPVIYLTAHSDARTLQRAALTEPYGYILKPFEDRELHMAIEIALYKHQMEKKLKESERWLATTLKSIGDGVIATDSNGQIDFMNPIAEMLTGWTQAEGAGQELSAVFNIISEETRAPAKNPVTRVLQEGIIARLANDTVLVTRDGKEMPIEDSAAPIRDKQGKITGVVLVFHDITERKRAEEKLRESDQQFRAITATSPDALLVTRLSDGLILYANEQCGQLIGLALSELIGQRTPDFYANPEDRRRLLTAVESEEFASGFELLLKRVDGATFWAMVSARRGTFEGEPVLYAGIRDIAESKRAEAALRESEEKYRSLFETMLDGFALHEIICDEQGRPQDYRFLEINAAFERLTGLRRENLIGRTALEALPGTEAYWIETYGEVALMGAPKHFENYSSVLKRQYEVVAYCPRRGQFAVIFSDITERKRAEQEMKYRLELEQLVSSLSANFINMPIEQIDAGITQALQKIAEFTGTVRSSVFVFSDNLATMTNTHEWCADPGDSQMGLLQGIPFESLGYYRGLLLRLENVVVSRLDDLPPDLAGGEREWSQAHGFRPLLFAPMISAGVLYGTLGFYGQIGEERVWPEGFVTLLKFVCDIIVNALERKRAEQALRESEAKLKKAQAYARLGSWTWNIKTNQLDWSDEMFHLFGVEKETFSGSLETVIAQAIHPEDRLKVEQSNLSVSQHSQTIPLEYRVVWPDQSVHVVWAEAGEFLFDEAGQPALLSGTVQDITERKQAEEALRAIEAQYRELWNATLEGIVIHDKGILIEVNDAMCRMFGVEREQAIGKSLFVFVPPEMRDRLRERVASGVEGHFESPALRADGTRLICEIFAKQILYQGKPARMVAIRDITERKRAEEALRENEAIFSSFLEHSPVYIFFKDKEDRSLRLSRNFEQMLGMPLQRALGKTMDELFPSDLAKSMMADDLQILNGGQRMNVIEELGGRIYETTKFPILHDGQPFMLAGFTVDITERKWAEEEILKFKLGIERSTDAVFMTDVQGAIVYTNPAFERVYGYSPKETLGQTPRILKSGLTSQENYKHFWGALLAGDVVAGEIVNKRKDGLLITIEGSNNSIVDEAGNIVGFLGVHRDITERKRAETERQVLLDITQGLVATNDLQDFLSLVHNSIAKVVYAENFFVILYNKDTDLFEEVYSVDKFDPPSPPARLKKSISAYVFRSGRPLLPTQAQFDELVMQGEVELVGTNSPSWLGVPLKTPGETIGVMVIQDYDKPNRYSEHDLDLLASIAGQVALVTERKRAEEKLRESERLLKESQIIASLGSYALDIPAGTWKSSNMLDKVFGIDEAYERSVEGWAALIHPDDRQQMVDYFTNEVIGQRIRFDREYKIVRNNDRAERWVHGLGELEFDDRNRPVKMYGTIHDITERKQAEVALANANADLERALLNATELAVVAQAANRAKSEFLANMSHEIRTPLTAVLGLTEMTLASELTDDQHAWLGQVYASGLALLELINNILDLSKIEAARLELDKVEFELPAHIQQVTATLAGRAAAKQLDFNYSLSVDAPQTLVGDPVRLRQILLNLLDNAIKFTERGEVSLRARVEARNVDEVTLHFAVRDTGIGIPQDKQAIIFEPFAQADGHIARQFGGTGLGLTISQRLVEKFGGHMWVESRAGEGSTFHFTALFALPAQLRQPGGAERASTEETGLTKGYPLNILLAEDNPANQIVLSNMLKKRGWQVTVAVTGAEALECVAEDTFHLILMDLQMPDMDGLAATAAIRAREQGTGGHVPILAITAFAMRGDRERCLQAGMDEYLSKPVNASELYGVIERLISPQVS